MVVTKPVSASPKALGVRPKTCSIPTGPRWPVRGTHRAEWMPSPSNCAVWVRPYKLLAQTISGCQLWAAGDLVHQPDSRSSGLQGKGDRTGKPVKHVGQFETAR